jgi:2-C-methyl-D-erythritol 4-phosphate cytidylyltransferase
VTIAAQIMAGGSGQRFAAGAPKQLAVLCGVPMLAWPARVLARSSRVDSLVLVGPAGAESDLRAALPEAAAAKLHAYAAGGETRQASVYNGLAAVPAGTTHVLIHDAARPCLSDALCERVLDALAQHDAVVPVVAASDTLVHAREGRVDAIIDRVNVGGVQTPQAFRLELIVKAHRVARARGFESSDDGSLVLAMKEPVCAVAGERTNTKVTWQEDVVIAEAVLNAMRGTT